MCFHRRGQDGFLRQFFFHGTGGLLWGLFHPRNQWFSMAMAYLVQNKQTAKNSTPSRELTYQPKNGILKMIFLFPQVGYVSFLEGISLLVYFCFKNGNLIHFGWEELFLQFILIQSNYSDLTQVFGPPFGGKFNKGNPLISEKSRFRRLVKNYSIWPDGIVTIH